MKFIGSSGQKGERGFRGNPGFRGATGFTGTKVQKGIIVSLKIFSIGAIVAVGDYNSKAKEVTK